MPPIARRAAGDRGSRDRLAEYNGLDMTTAYDEARARLIGDSIDRDWYDLWPSVTAARTELLRALEGVSEETAARRPGGGEGEAAWSLAEVTRHALKYTRNVRAIIEATSRGRTAAKDARGLLDDAGVATFAELRRQLIVESVSLAALPEQLPEPPNLDVTVGHAVLGQLNCRAWYLFLTLHDSDHTRQVRALRGTV